MADHEPSDPTDETRLPGGRTPSEPYTVHADALAPSSTTSSSTPPPASMSTPADPSVRRRGGPDPIALVAGLVGLVVAVLAATDTLQAVDPRWVLAAAAVLVGGSVLVASLRRRA